MKGSSLAPPLAHTPQGVLAGSQGLRGPGASRVGRGAIRGTLIRTGGAPGHRRPGGELPDPARPSSWAKSRRPGSGSSWPGAEEVREVGGEEPKANSKPKPSTAGAEAPACGKPSKPSRAGGAPALGR